MIKYMNYLALLSVAVLISGCGIKHQPQPVENNRPAPEIVSEDTSKDTSRMLASNRFASEGFEQLQRGDIDGAIATLERAVSINPKDGVGYYYLAESWLAKGNKALATQYNTLARIYLRQDRKWLRLAEDQQERIGYMD